MKKYIAVLEIEDDKEIIDASVSYSYSYNGMNYKATEIVELKEESEDARNKTYEDGLNEAWEAARIVVDCKVPYDFWDMGSGQSMLAVFKRYSAKEAIEKIREYEEKQKEAAEIKVGDEVIYDCEKCIVTAIANGGYTVMLLGLGGGYMVRTTRDEIQGKSTGRHFPQIGEVLKRMQEG